MDTIKNLIILGLVNLLIKNIYAESCGHGSILLPNTYEPRHYGLRISPESNTNLYVGQVSIKIEANDWTNPSNKIILHTDQLNELDLSDIKLELVKLEPENATTILSIEDICFDEELELLVIDYDIGPITEAVESKKEMILTIEFRKSLRNDYRGLHRTNQLDKDFTYTGFGRNQMRNVFPCFDEPRFLATISLSLDVKKNYTAISITDIEDIEPIDDINRIKFSITEPISTQQLAFAIFREITPKTILTSQDVKLNVYTPNHPDKEIPIEEISELFDQIHQRVSHWHPRKTFDIVFLNDIGSRVANGIGLVVCDIDRHWISGEETPVEARYEKRYDLARVIANQWIGLWILRASALDSWLYEGLIIWLSLSALSGESHSFSLKMHYFSTTLNEAFEIQGTSEAWPIIPPLMMNEEYFHLKESTSVTKSDEILDYYIDNSAKARSLCLLRTVREFFDFRMFDKIRKFIGQYRSMIFRTSDFIRILLNSSKNDLLEFILSYITRQGYPLIKVDFTIDGEDKVFQVAQERFQRDYLESKPSNFDMSYDVPLVFSFGKFIGGKKYRGRAFITASEPGPIQVGLQKGVEWMLFNRKYTGFYRVIYSNRILSGLTSPWAIQADNIERLMQIEDARALLKANRVGPSYLVKILNIFKIQDLKHVRKSSDSDLVNYAMISAFNEVKLLLRGTRHEIAINHFGRYIFENLFVYHGYSEDGITCLKGLLGRRMIYEFLAETNAEFIDSDSLRAVQNPDWIHSKFRRAIATSLARNIDTKTFELLVNTFNRHRNIRQDIALAMSSSRSLLRLDRTFNLSHDRHRTFKFLENAMNHPTGRQFLINRILFKTQSIIYSLGTETVRELVKILCTTTLNLIECADGGPFSMIPFLRWQEMRGDILAAHERKIRILRADDDELEIALSSAIKSNVAGPSH